MSDEIKKLQERVKQLEESLVAQAFLVPPGPDPTLAEDEWYAIFSDFRNLKFGSITKTAWPGGSNMTAVFKVKRIG